MSIVGRISALTDRIRGKAPEPATEIATVAEGPPKVECHIPGINGVVVGGPSFLVVSGPLGKRQYDQIAQASSDMITAGVTRVGLLVDSGGGDMAGVDGAVKALVELRSHLNEDLFTLAEGMAASSAYALLACGGRGRIFATSGSQVGSIGPKIRLEDSTRAFQEDLKIDVHEVTAGQELKPVGAPGFPITDDALEFETEQVAAAKDVFHRMVADAKRVPMGAIVRAAGRGGLYQASVALDLGLVDRITDKVSFLAMVNGETSPTPSEEEFPMASPEPPVFVSPPVTNPAPTPGTQAAAPPPDTTARELALEAAARIPAAPKANDATDMATVLAAVSALAETQKTQAASQQALIDSMKAEREARDTAQVDASIAAAKARVEACVGRSITRSGADLQITAAEATIRSGASPEGILAAVEALPDVAEFRDLTTQITVSQPGQESHDVTINFDHFSSPGKGGAACVSPAVRARATEGIQAINNAPPGQGMAALEELYSRVGFLPGKAVN